MLSCLSNTELEDKECISKHEQKLIKLLYPSKCSSQTSYTNSICYDMKECLTEENNISESKFDFEH